MTEITGAAMRLTGRFLSVLRCAAVLSVWLASGAAAQDTTARRAMRIEDYARWRSIVSVSISDDGTWMTYAYRTHRSDDTLFVRNLQTGHEYVIPRGSEPAFSDDSRWVACTVRLTFDAAEKLRRDKKPVPDSAAVLRLATGDRVGWGDVASFAFAHGSGFLAIKKDAADRDATHTGSDLILRHLLEGYDESIGNVGEFAFNDPGTHLAFTIDAAGRSGNAVHVYDLATSTRRVLDNDTLLYARLTWDEHGSALAVLKGAKLDSLAERANALVAFTDVTRRPRRFDFDPAERDGFPAGFVVSERGTVSWSEDVARVFFGIKEQEAEFEEDDDRPVANVDLFHWDDDRLQTVQERQANRDRDFTYRAALNLPSGRFVQLTDSTMRAIDLTRDGAWGIGRDDRAYVSDWEEDRADYYRVNTATGERVLMFEAQKRTLGLSPDSKHFLYWKDGHVWDYAIARGASVNLTASAPVSFVDEQYDHPGTKPPYGVAGWTKDGKAVVLNHRYDLWLQPLNGSPATVLTGGVGDAERIRFDYVRLDPEERFVDLSRPVVLSAYGDLTKRIGYYVLERGRLEPRIFGDMAASRLQKARNADRVLFTIETFRDFPNYHASDLRMAERTQVTDANPWQSEYTWGTNILIEYTNKDGVPLQGVLSIPDAYRPGQRLPMLVDFYEKNSQNLYRYPRAVFRDTPMFGKYVSNGYLVLLPDVHFNTGTTHDDMLDCVEAATRKVIELGYADPERIGLHGHSFSGGGASYIATRSTMFAAIVAGAAPIDLAAEFNILFHASGMNNHSYDIYGQGRYGTNPFDDFELYRSQSPITWVATMDTPLLYLHGTVDGSVEYLQGMEFYNALRFLQKPVIFASYPGEDHHLAKLENQKDFMTRMEQFYDHYLKGAPAPDWMVNGVPFLKKRQAARALMEGREPEP
jgi:dipeptidyl aminopeptidase/acylaminoacyl peptidase